MALKILWVCPYLPWPTVGGNRVRLYQLIRNFAARGHRITLLVQTDTELDELTRAALTPLLERLIVLRRRRRRHPLTLAAVAFGPHPVIVSINGYSRGLRATVARLLDERWDVLQVEHSYSLQSFLSLLQRRRQPFVLTEHNVESTLVSTNTYHPRVPTPLLPYLQRYDGWRFRRWERRALSAATRLIAVSREDADCMAAIAGRSVEVVPNGADVAAFADVRPDTGSRRIMFIGNFGYPPNDEALQWAAAQILPRVWQEIPDARFVVCGNLMRAEWTHRWPDPRIEWRGYVEDLSAVQRSCAMFLAPLRAGGGSKLKVLEAMAAGLAVVSTPEGVSGLTARDGHEYLQGRGAEELAARVIELLPNAARLTNIGEAGRRYVRDEHNWLTLSAQLENIYRQLPART